MAYNRTGGGKRYSYLASYYIKSRFLHVKQPLLAGIKLTHTCNLKCGQCPFWRKEKGSLSFTRAKAVFERLHGLGVRFCIIEGGEPFLWKDDGYDIHDITDEAKKWFFSVGITTNGTFPLHVDSDILWVSIDGLKETHDRLRGKSFDRIITHIRDSSHPYLYAHITVNSMNWKEIPELVEYLTGMVKGITIQFYYPYQEVGKHLFLPFADRGTVLDALISLKKRAFPILNSYAALQAMKNNCWKCRPWMITSVEPDGEVTHGCYVKNRDRVSCGECGFSAHTEISLAYNGVMESILVGKNIFLKKRKAKNLCLEPT